MASQRTLSFRSADFEYTQPGSPRNSVPSPSKTKSPKKSPPKPIMPPKKSPSKSVKPPKRSTPKSMLPTKKQRFIYPEELSDDSISDEESNSSSESSGSSSSSESSRSSWSSDSSQSSSEMEFPSPRRYTPILSAVRRPPLKLYKTRQ